MNSCIKTRTTKETDIKVELSLKQGEIEIDTGIGFLDHMLSSFALHGGFSLKVKVNGDLYVDTHHTAEDTAIVLGKAFDEILEDRSGISRFGYFYVPMDESLAFTSVDISGRPFLCFDAKFPQDKIGEYDTCMTEEFMRAFCFNAYMTLHAKVMYGSNSHHMTEALFKSLAKSLRMAILPNDSGSILSAKGVL